MKNQVIVYLKKPINVGMQMVQRQVKDTAGNVRSLPYHENVQSNSRTFSLAEHGENFQEVAKLFIDSHENDVLKVEGLNEDIGAPPIGAGTVLEPAPKTKKAKAST